MKNYIHNFLIIVLTVLISSCKTEKHDLQDDNNYSEDQVIESELINFVLDTITTAVDIPWGMTWLPGGDMLITERSGMLYKLNNQKELVEISGLPSIHANGQGGLLDIELHPEYDENGWIYFAYSSPSPDNQNASNTAIMRAKLSGMQLVEKEKIFQGKPYSEKGYHYGCRIEFDNDGFLYFSIGDRGERDRNPQSLDNHCGKIMRIHPDGTVPDENPFVHTEDALPEIFSYGHRNPQGIAMDPGSGKIWIHEHGPKGGDEINIIEAGKNYGWPIVTYGINYDGTIITEDTIMEGMEQPIWYWTPSIAPCGMDFIEGEHYEKWQGNLFVASLVLRYLERCEVVDNKIVHREKLLQDIARVRNVKIAPDGFIYIATETPGAIYRIVPVKEK